MAGLASDCRRPGSAAVHRPPPSIDRRSTAGGRKARYRAIKDRRPSRQASTAVNFNSAGFWLLRAIKQFADPSARRMLAAETEDGNSDRNADEGAEEAPQKCPQQGREQHERGRNR